MTYKTHLTNRFTRLLGTGFAAAATLLAAGALQAQDNNSPPNTGAPQATHRDKSFLQDAGQGNQVEISMAQVARDRSQNSDIKKLAETIRDDHQKADQEVQRLAQARNVTIDEAPSMMQKHELNKLGKLSGSEFDQEYAKAMLKDHATDIKAYRNAAAKLQDPELQHFAQNMVPKLQLHLQLAAQAARSVGVDQTTISSYLDKAGATSQTPGADQTPKTQP